MLSSFATAQCANPAGTCGGDFMIGTSTEGAVLYVAVTAALWMATYVAWRPRKARDLDPVGS